MLATAQPMEMMQGQRHGWDASKQFILTVTTDSGELFTILITTTRILQSLIAPLIASNGQIQGEQDISLLDPSFAKRALIITNLESA